MPTLSGEQRNKLERVVIEARDAAEAGARAALEALAVHHHEPYSHMNPAQRGVRNHLRARARQLGDRQDASGRLVILRLVGECAYEHWHRMLFARFLAENGLLIEPKEKIAISLSEAEELAKEAGVDVWEFASRCAQDMLPQIFRSGDPLLQVSFAREHRVKLEKLLDSLPQAVFNASDALGWVYQFWQSKKKDEVNRSEVKIGADEIAAVTQLFTEPYMVQFLLHNTLGAWWAGKKLDAKDAENAKTEDELRAKVSLPGVDWEYLRFVRGEDGKGGPWRPAAGTFDGWPKRAAEFKVLDPCCGSGHFLVAALHHLVPIRKVEESLSAREVVDAVLRDNLHGLEIDERCCQVAAFALAFAAWTYPDAGGYRPLPDLHIACTGIGPQCTPEQWVKLAEQSGISIPSDQRQAIENGLLNLHRLFSQAPTLGSLINPGEVPADLITAHYETIQPYLSAILKTEKTDEDTRERAIAAAGMLRAAELLAGKYDLVITNVPYLSRNKFASALANYVAEHFSLGKSDLATVFVLRCHGFLRESGTAALVTLENWLFLDYHMKLRKKWLRDKSWYIAARLGAGAFAGISGEVVKACLLVLGQTPPVEQQRLSLLEVGSITSPLEKDICLRKVGVHTQPQCVMLDTPNNRVIFGDISSGRLLEELATFHKGICTGDDPRFKGVFWELGCIENGWMLKESSFTETKPYIGKKHIFFWQEGDGEFYKFVCDRLGDSGVNAWIRGREAWGRRGVVIQCIGDLPATMYLGCAFDSNVTVIIPRDDINFPALWTFCSSSEFSNAVLAIDHSLKVPSGTLLRIPFDLDHWQEVAAKKFPNGLPEPESDDPTQWLFHGRPEESNSSLQVAVARILGYRWPAELDEKIRLSKRAQALVKRCEDLAGFADNDGIVCIPSVRGEEPAAERLLALLAAAGVKPAKVRELAGGMDLDDWLRNSFFEEHCRLFHDRPFIWHIWDGRKRDGFHALVNYHKLCGGEGKGRKVLESVTYAYLGEWITRQKDGVKRGEGGAEDRLAAAVALKKRLEAILAGEPPFDLFVRWKPLHKQPIGWEPDINDGVRVNIRPFLASDIPNGRAGAGVLRYKPNVKWTKDRGKEPERPKAEQPWFWGWDEKTEDFPGGKKFDGNRWNACHYTNKVKQAARDVAKGTKRG